MTRKSVIGYGGAALLGGAAAGVGAGVGLLFGAITWEAIRGARPLDDGPDDQLASPAERVAGTVLTADGTRLNVVTYGPSAREQADRDVIVFVNGWTCTTEYWNPQLNHLLAGSSGDRTVVAYDQRGHGRSELGTRKLSVDILGQDLDAVLSQVVPPGRKAVLVGHSMGGMTIMSWAQQFPDRVAQIASSVVLVSTAAADVVQNIDVLPQVFPRYTTPFRPLVTKMITSTPIPLPRTAVGHRVAHYATLGPDARVAHVNFVDDLVCNCSARARAGWGSAMGKLNVTSGLRNLTVPVTVVVGSADRLTPPAHADFMAEMLRHNGTLRDYVTYDGVGHMLSIEAEDDFNILLDKVLAEISPIS